MSERESADLPSIIHAPVSALPMENDTVSFSSAQIALNGAGISSATSTESPARTRRMCQSERERARIEISRTAPWIACAASSASWQRVLRTNSSCPRVFMTAMLPDVCAGSMTVS